MGSDHEAVAGANGPAFGSPPSGRSGMRLDIGLILPLPLRSRGYLVYQSLGSILVNGAINFGFAWPMRHRLAIPVFGGSGSAFFDTCVTAILLSALTVVVGSWFVKHDIKGGVTKPVPRRNFPRMRWIPRATVLRALLFAAIFSAIGIPVGLAFLGLLGTGSMTFAQFLSFKLAFAIVLGALVTPLNAAIVISP